MQYNLLISLFIVSGSSFKLASISFWLIPIILWAFPCFLAPKKDVLDSSCTFPAIVVESVISSKSPGSSTEECHLEGRWVLGVLIAAGVLLLPGPSIDS